MEERERLLMIKAISLRLPFVQFPNPVVFFFLLASGFTLVRPGLRHF